jgi:hypothetical protein
MEMEIMFKKAKFIAPIATAALAGVLIGAPAFAQHHGHAGSWGGGRASAPMSSGIHSGGSMGRPAAPMTSSRHGPAMTGQAYGGQRAYHQHSYAQNWRDHGGDRHGLGRDHHHRFHRGPVFFGGGPFYGYDAYAYDYDDSWAYPYGDEGCYVRRVRFHHHWHWRRYCY